MTWAPQGIRVNGITPGGTATEMIDTWEAATPGVVERINAAIPLGRMAEPREVAEVAAWLLSDRRPTGALRCRAGVAPAGYSLAFIVASRLSRCRARRRG